MEENKTSRNCVGTNIVGKRTAMLLTKVDDLCRISVILSGELLEKVECFRPLELHVAKRGGMEIKVRYIINEREKCCEHYRE